MVNFYKPEPRKISVKHFSVNVTDIDIKGRGVGKENGVTWFIPGALINEKVVVREKSRKGNIGEAELISVLERNPERLSPKCRYFNSCGGCSLQYMPLAMENKIKVDGFKRLIKKVTNKELQDPELIFSGKDYGYRRSLRLSVQGDRREIHVGFREVKGKKIIEIDDCPVLEPELSSLVVPVREVMNKISNFKLIGHIELANSSLGSSMLVRTINVLPASDEQILKEFGNEHNVLVYLLVRHEKGREELEQREELRALNPEIFGNEKSFYDDSGLKVSFVPGDFIQVNSEVNKEMVQKAVSYLELSKEDDVWDLFSGLGNFTLSIATKANHVYGVEVVRNMVEEARKNATANGLNNVEFIMQDLAEDFTQTVWAKSSVNKVLLDPGRNGAELVIPYIIKKKVNKIVYVSCNPLTLVRDIKPLLMKGYEIEKWSAFNMFPKTEHLEVVVSLRLNSNS